MNERESDSKNASLTPSPESLGTSDDSSISLGNVANSLLQFLSNASNETTAATSVGLSILIYFVFGRLGLLLIGIVVGVVLHASWEIKESSNSAQFRLQKRKQLKRTGLEVVDTLLHWRTEANNNLEQESQAGDGNRGKFYDINDLKALPKTADAIEQLKDAVLQNYVMWVAFICIINSITDDLQFLVFAPLS